MTMNWKKLLCKERPRISTSGGDHRDQFERDYDRAIFSTPVKRLQDKAQVFPLEPHDAVRTRLTHSLEVSSVARGLARAVGEWLVKKGDIGEGDERCIEAICATCGLIHDLGNPPFGHSGEDAIRYWFSTRFEESELGNKLEEDIKEGVEIEQLIQDFILFEGNAQSLRLLTKLQILADFNGLNLTYGTLSASCKYTAASNEVGKCGNHSKLKPGYFASENDIIEKMRSKTGTGDARNPLTFLVEAADDIVYSVADIEDAVKKGVIQWKEVKDDLLDTLGDDIENSENPINKALSGMENILKAGRDKVPAGLSGDIYASAFRTASIGVVVSSVVAAFEAKYDDIMSGKYNSELIKDSEAQSLIKALKKIGGSKVYCTPSNLKLELMGRRVICDLMDIFWEGAKALPLGGKLGTKTFAGKAGTLLSANYRDVFWHFAESKEFPVTYYRLQLVTDYVCGMTDTFAKRLHAELTNG